MASRSYLAKYGPQLLAKGYPIVPIRAHAKHPGFDGWQQTEADTAQLKKWLSNGFAQGGVGVLTRDLPAVDIDVQDPELVQQLVAWCEEHIGPTVQRVGRAPKQLLAYRTDEPFAKIASTKYVDFLGLEHKVEILGDGQQFVAYAKHPDTGQPYEWVSDDSLVDVDVDALPLIDATQARELVDYFESLIPDDWEVAETAPSSKSVDMSIPEEERVLAHAKPKVDISTVKLAAALGLLDPDMRMHDWVRIGMALYHQYDGSAEGFGLWDVWSADGAKYDEKEMRARWKSFKADLRGTNPVTVATIIQLAKAEKKKTDKKKPPIDKFLDRYVFVEHGNLVCDLHKPPHCAVSQLSEFKNATANVRHLVPAPTKMEPEKTKLQPVHFAWLVDPDRKTAQGTRYDPSEAFFFEDSHHSDIWWVNEFSMPEFDEGAGETEIFYEHASYLFPIKREREWFIDWMAFNLQYPERRCNVTPLHIALAHGTGRGWLVQLMGKLLGQWNCTKTKMAVLCGEGSAGSYQDYLDKSLFCAIEEVREGGRRYSISDKTRDLLEAPYLEVNVKFGGKKTQAVFTNFFLMSNHPDALVIGEEDRRINVFTGPDKARDGAYYLALYEWLGTDGVAALYQELMGRDLSKFDWQHSFVTAARSRMIDSNRTETETLFHEFMKEPPFPAMTFTQIVQAMLVLSERDTFDTNIDEGQLLKLLQHHATQAARMKIGGRQGKARRPWVLDAAIQRDTKAIREAVTECGL